MYTLEIEYASDELLKAIQAMVQENALYSCEFRVGSYHNSVTVGCKDYESLRRLIGVIDEIKFFENDC